MTSLKHSLIPEGESFAAGGTDLRSYLNRPLDMAGSTVLICETGSADFSINFNHQHFSAGHILITIGDMAIVPTAVSEDFSAFILSISQDLIDDNIYKCTSDFCDFLYINPILPTTSGQRRLLAGWQEQILWMTRSQNRGKAAHMIANAFGNLFFAIESVVANIRTLSDRRYKMSRRRMLINRFEKLLLEHNYDNRSVSYFAEQLCISPYYLYKIVAEEFNTTPKEMIDFYRVLELKMMLTTTDLSVKEIAEKMNFEDPSYLNRYFRRQVGVSLTEFRKGNG